jgi:hypothetical protein
MRRMASSTCSSSFLGRGSVLIFALDEGRKQRYDSSDEDSKAAFKAHAVRILAQICFRQLLLHAPGFHSNSMARYLTRLLFRQKNRMSKVSLMILPTYIGMSPPDYVLTKRVGERRQCGSGVLGFPTIGENTRQELYGHYTVGGQPVLPTRYQKRPNKALQRTRKKPRASERQRWAADIAKKGFLTRNGIFSFLTGNFDCLAIRAGGAFRPSLNR